MSNSKFYDILVLGNGFDLACGFQTDYKTFYNILQINELSKKEFFERLHSIVHSVDEKEKGRNGNAKLNLFFNSIHCSKNIFIKYFKKYSVIFGDWISIEKELLNIAKSYDMFFEKLKEYDFSNKYYDFVCSFKKGTYENRTFVLIEDCDYYEAVNQSGDELFYFKILQLSKIPPIIWNAKVDKYIDDFSKYLYFQLNEFIEIFRNFIFFVTHNNYSKRKFKVFASRIIDYNYTDVVCNQFNNSFKFEICHINGAINHNKKKNLMVLGFNQSEKLVNSNLYALSKSVQRVDKLTDYTKLSNYLNHLNPYKVSIAVFGHSLDIADSDSLKSIFNVSIHAKIDIYFYNKETKLKLISNLRAILSDDLFEKKIQSKEINFLDSNLI